MILLLGVYPEEITKKTCKDLMLNIFTPVLFGVKESWKQAECLGGDQLSKLWCSHTKESYVTIKITLQKCNY